MAIEIVDLAYGWTTERVVVRTSNYVIDFSNILHRGGVTDSFKIPTLLLSSLSTSTYVSIPCKTSSEYVVIFSLNFQLR